jgi:hypothetical protein
MKQITRMWDIEEGKRYFMMKVERNGTVRTGIVMATVVTYSGKPIINNANLQFTIEEGDVYPGPIDVDFIAEID